MTLANGSLWLISGCSGCLEGKSYSQRSLKSYFVLLDTLDCLGWDRSLAIPQLRGHINWLPLNWRLCYLLACISQPLIVVPYLSCSKDVLHRLRDFWSNTVSLNQTDCIQPLR
jgi:hypothetical protein